MMNIQDLPAEILENIFANFVPVNGDRYYEKKAKIKQLLNCMEVCKLFNEIIGRSERLMSGIQIRWDKTMEPFLTTSRMYRNIQIAKNSAASTNLFDFLKKQPKISFLRMGHDLQLQAQDFWMIIDAVKNNLKELDISHVELSGDPVLIPIYIPNLRKIHLFYNDLDKGMEQICYLFDNSENLEEFVFFTGSSLNSDFFTKVEAFLIDCKRLKILNFYGTILDKIFETSNFTERANFQLKNIYFSWENAKNDLNSQMFTNLNLFMKKQAFIEELVFNQFCVTDNVLDTIFGIKTLKKLVLYEPEFEIVHNVHVRSTSIETLEISGFEMYHEDDDIEWYTGVCNVIKGCPAVRELNLSNLSFTDMVAEHVVEHLKRLESLEVCMQRKIHLVNVPTLRTLILSGNIFVEFNREQGSIVLEFIQQNPQLTKIRIHEDYEEDESLEELPNVAQGRLEYYNYYY